MNRLAVILSAIGVLLASGGCSTPYKSNGFRGGYSETLLAPDLFRVFFRGNGHTSHEKVQDFALLRAAELAEQYGYPFFLIVDEQNLTTAHSFATPGNATTTGSVNFYGNQANYSEHTTYNPAQIHTYYKPKTGLLVKCLKTKPENQFAFDAAFIAKSIKEKYGIKE